MQKKLAIGYVTAMWGRHWLTEQVFRYVNSLRKRLAPQIELVPAVAGSEGEISRRIASENDFLYVETDNSPLGAKWNAALGLLKNLPLAGVCIFGSDDLANESYFTDLARLIREGHELVALSGLYFFDQESHRLLHWKGYPAPRENDSAGAGRFIGKPILERLDWRLWPDNVQSGLDDAMRKQLAASEAGSFHLMPCREDAAVAMDIKGSGGMNSFESIAACGESMVVGNARAFFTRNFGEELAGIFFGFHKEEAFSENALLWREWKDETGAANAVQVWCVEEDRFSAPAMDFMNACREAGLGARWSGIEEYLNNPPAGGNGLFYGELGASSLLVQLLDAGRAKVLDAREMPAQVSGSILDRLPFPCIGPDGQGSMPLPFSSPPDYPSFAQRANIVCCLESGILRQAVTVEWQTGACRTPDAAQSLFFTDVEWDISPLHKKGIFALEKYQIFPLRASFRLVIFTPSTFGRLASYFLAGGTPGICLGAWPFDDKAEGIMVTRDLSSAMKIAARLVRNEKMWSSRAAEARRFSQKKAAQFRKALFGYIDRFNKGDPGDAC